MDATQWFNFGVPTALLVIVLGGIAWMVRAVTGGFREFWVYLTGDGESGRPLGVITEIKDRHFEFMSTVQTTLLQQSKATEQLIQDHEHYMKVLEDHRKWFEIQMERLQLEIRDSRCKALNESPAIIHHQPGA